MSVDSDMKTSNIIPVTIIAATILVGFWVLKQPF